MDKKQAEIIKGRLIQLLDENIYENNRVGIYFSPRDLIVLIDALDLAAVNEYQSCEHRIDGLNRRIEELEGIITGVEEALGHE